MIVDLRSDTVTKPTKEMLDAMHSAKVGDDVFGEDETVNELEKYTAELFGMESGLFCPSGTMTNQIAIKVHTNPPGELICDELSHIYQYEGGGIAFNSGLSAGLIKGDLGRIDVKSVQNKINPMDVHKPVSQLVSLENTCNKGGGSIYELDSIVEISDLCQKNQLKLHLDGARLFNAIVAQNQDHKFYGKHFDSISICLSKGLGAPVGSVLIGNRNFIDKARRIRKIFGGGMRQAGILAAAGKYALLNNVNRLQDDHKLAKEIINIIEEYSFVTATLPVETNIVVFELHSKIDVQQFLSHLKQFGILAVPFGGQMIRFVTHLDVNENCLDLIKKVFANYKFNG